MKELLSKYVGLFLGLLLLSVNVFAADLTDAQVKNYIASVKAFEKMELDNDAFGSWLAEADVDSEGSDDMLSMVKMVKQSPRDANYKKAEKIVQQHSFSSLQQWAEVADQVHAAAIALMLGADSRNLQHEMQRAKAEIENMKGLSLEQKEMMLSMATAGMDMVSGWGASASDADIKVVRRHLKELSEVMELPID